MWSFATLREMLHNGVCKKMNDFRHKNTLFPHNFRGYPGTTLASIKSQNNMNYNSNIQKDSDLNATTSVEMPEILIGTNSTQDVQQDLILLSIIEGMKNE